MAYLSDKELLSMGFKRLGSNVKISDKAAIYDCHKIEIGDNSRVDDFCIVSGNVVIGRNTHITPQCLVAGGSPGIIIGDFIALAYGVKVFAQSDDYSGETMVNSTIPKKYKAEIFEAVSIGKHSIVGAGSIIMPGVEVSEGSAIGANSLVIKSTEPWSINVGSPSRKIKERSRDLLNLEKKYLECEK